MDLFNLIDLLKRHFSKASIVMLLFALFIMPKSVLGQLNASFNVNRSQGCVPLVVAFINTSTGSPDSCIWDFGNGNQSNECTPLATFTTPGDYIVKLTVKKNGQQSVATRTIKVFRDPIADFTTSVTRGCFPFSTQFNDISTAVDAPIVSRTWGFGDGRVSSASSPTNTYLSTGDFDVTLIVTDANGCKNAITKVDEVASVPRPIASFTIQDTIACTVPFTTRFINTSQSIQELNYNWSFGDGGSSTDSSPSYTYTSVGDFSVKLEVENVFGCKDDTTVGSSVTIETVQASINLSDSLGCAPFVTSYSANVNVPVQSYKWLLNGESISNSPNGSLDLTVAGNFNLSLEVTSFNGCKRIVSRNIRSGNTPTVDFTATPTSACSVPMSVQFNSIVTNTDSMRWNLSGGSISINANPTRVFTQRGSFDIRLTVFNKEGCTNTLLKRDFIVIEDPVLEIQATKTGGCAPYVTNFTLVKTGFGTISNIAWDFGNGNTFNGIIPPAQTYSTTGNFTVRANVSFSDGCNPRIVTLRVSAGTLPSFTPSISTLSTCASDSVRGSIPTSPPGIIVYTWDWGNGETSIGRNVSYRYPLIGNYTAKVTASNLGCELTRSLGVIEVKPANAQFSISSLCGGLEVRFQNRSEGATTSTWNFGDGSPPVTTNSVLTFHRFPGYGQYNVTLTVSNASTGCTDKMTRFIDLRDNRPQLALTEQKGCAPFNAVFSVPDTTIRTLRWDFGDTIIQGRNITKNFPIPGAYDVKVYTLSQEGCRDTFLFANLIKSVKPDVDFTFNPLGGCAPITVNFTDNSTSAFSTINQWAWDFGGLGVSNQKNPTFPFSLTDTIPINLVVTDNLGCKDTLVKELPVSFPKADFSAPFNSICTGTPYPIQNLSSGVALKYSWNYGNGLPVSSDTLPRPIYTQEGTYSIKLVVTDDNNCKDSIVKNQFVKVENFTYDFVGDDRFRTCPELVTNFSLSPSNILYNEAFWDFGNGEESLDTSRFTTAIYNQAGVFDVKLMLEDYRGCRDTIIKTEYIKVEGPRATFTVVPDSGCAPLNVTFNANIFGSKTNYWDFGDGGGLVDTTQILTLNHTYTLPGIASPSLVIDDGLGCVVLVKGPEVKMGNLTGLINPSLLVACNNETIVFTDTGSSPIFSPSSVWEWDFGDGNTANGQTVSHTYSTSGNSDYVVKLRTSNSFGCFDEDSISVKVYSKPPLLVSDDMVICLGDEAQLSASGVQFYDWTPKNTLLNSQTASPTSRTTQDVEYVVLGYDIPSCPAYDTVRVKVVNKIDAIAGPDTTLCLGESLQLFVEHTQLSSGTTTYQWSPSIDLSDAQIANPIANPSSDKMYTVTVSNGNCQPTQIPVFVRVAPKPELSVGDNVSIFKGQSTQLQAFSTQDVTYSWFPLQNLSCANCPFPIASPTSTTTYQVSATNDEGCSNTQEIQVVVYEMCDGTLLEVPNVFSPNNDGLNDVFSIRGGETNRLKSLKIYSRTGQMVFESMNQDNGWDGTFNGTAVNAGVYVYILEAQCSNGEVAIKQGNITLLK